MFPWHFSDVSLPLIWDKNCGVLSCRTHLSMKMCVGVDVSGGSVIIQGQTFPEKPKNRHTKKKKEKKKPFPSTCVLANHLRGCLSPSGVVEGTSPCPSSPQASCWAPEPFGCPWNGTKPEGSQPEPRLADLQAGGCHQGYANKLFLTSKAPQHPCPPHSLSAPIYPSLQGMYSLSPVAALMSLLSQMQCLGSLP